MNTKPPARGKIDAIDWFRFVAMAMMVQGHTFTAITRPSLREGLLLGYHDFLHGLTAPMFSFASGFVFGLTTIRSLRNGRLPARTLRGRFERYATLVFLGYLMHMKAPSLSVLVRSPGHLAAEWLVVDALQCIGVTLGLAQALALAVRSPGRYLLAVGALLAGVVLGAPIVDRASLEPLPLSIAAYLNGATGSLFPIFPWAGYVLLGILATRLFLDADGHLHPRAGQRVFASAIFAIAVSVLGTRFAPDFLGTRDYWTSSPWLFLGRSGGTLLVLAACIAIVPRLAGRVGGRTRPLLHAVSAESLVVYVVHLSILYGTPLTRSLRHRFDRDADLATSGLVALAVFVTAVLAALVWHDLKKRLPRATAAARRGSIGLILLRFVFAF